MSPSCSSSPLSGDPSPTEGAPNCPFGSTCSVFSCYSPQEKLKTRNNSKTFIVLCFSCGGQSKQEQLHRVHVFQTWRSLRISNIKSPGSYPFRFALAEKCYSCSTLSPVSLYNSFVHSSNGGWHWGGGGRSSRKAVLLSINRTVLSGSSATGG